MKLRVMVTLAAFGIAAGPLTAPQAAPGIRPVVAQAKKAKPAAAAGPSGQYNKNIRLLPRGLSWGISIGVVKKLYDEAFDKEFLPLYRKAQPGIEMKELDEELKDKKALIKRNLVQFGTLPTGIDQTPLKGEYTYRNAESMTRLPHRDGTVRHFFFFSDKLWKVYDEHPLKAGAKLGTDYEQAVAFLTKKLGAPPKRVEPDFKLKMYKEAIWSGKETVIRAVDRGASVVALIYADRNVLDNLDNYRRHQADDSGALDSSVSDVLRKQEPPPGAPPEEKPKGKGKGKAKAKPQE
jgi:hypothetical protein